MLVLVSDKQEGVKVMVALLTSDLDCTSPTFAQDMPFGGYKGSGQGREGIGYSLDEYLEIKSVLIKLDEA